MNKMENSEGAFFVDLPRALHEKSSSRTICAFTPIPKAKGRRRDDKPARARGIPDRQTK
jgi:hypothetical protein